MNIPRLISLTRLVPAVIFVLVPAVVPAGAQKVPATAREAATLPQVAPRLAHNRTLPSKASGRAHGPSCSPLPQLYGSQKALQDGLIYDNGPYNGTNDAWTINFGFATSDSFTGGSTVTGIQFVYWDASSVDLLTSVDIAVGLSSFGGSFQTSSSVTNTFLGTNQFGYNLFHADVQFPGASGGPGYVTLQNACSTSGCSVSNPIYWDENSGIGCTSEGCPSTAYENDLGSIPSETFTLTGRGGVSVCMPEESGNFKVIHDFSGQDGANPSGVAINQAGDLYGPTQFGNGTVFKLLKAGSDWVLSTLYSFAGGDQGASPEGVIIGLNGILYGSAYGGIPNCESGDYCGLIFGLRPAPTACLTGSCSWSENVPYSFTGPTDAWQGRGLVSDQAGNLYGVSPSGGAQENGAVFELAPSSSRHWVETILYSFTGGSDGGGPTTLLFGNDGNLYGMAAGGGTNGGGVVFQLTPSANGWTEAVLYDFPAEPYGTNPHSLLQDSAGNLFGIYEYSPCCGNTYGLIFMLSPSDGQWVFTELWHGDEQTYFGTDLFVNMTIDAAGNLHGTGGGHNGCLDDNEHGYIFELARTSDGWQYSTPVSWDAYTKFPTGGALALDAQGNLYGTTGSCGSHQHGTVWELTSTQ
jgi:uncharacterized repeat protein (TIGR03803 family)